jgi:hypothetical protein
MVIRGESAVSIGVLLVNTSSLRDGSAGDLRDVDWWNPTVILLKPAQRASGS